MRTAHSPVLYTVFSTTYVTSSQPRASPPSGLPLSPHTSRGLTTLNSQAVGASLAPAMPNLIYPVFRWVRVVPPRVREGQGYEGGTSRGGLRVREGASAGLEGCQGCGRTS